MTKPIKETLTPRQTECLRLMHQGLTTTQIAEAMHLREGTIRIYIHRVIQGLGVENRAQAILKYQAEFEGMTGAHASVVDRIETAEVALRAADAIISAINESDVDVSADDLQDYHDAMERYEEEYGPVREARNPKIDI